MKVNDENSRTRIQDPDPDPLVRGMDPRIRIRIHPKMSWIRNTAFKVDDVGFEGDAFLTRLFTDGLGLQEDGEDVVQSLVQRTAAGPRTFDGVDSGGEEVVHVREGCYRCWSQWKCLGGRADGDEVDEGG